MLNFILGLLVGIILVIGIILIIYKKYTSKLKLNQLDLKKMFDTDFNFNFKDSDFEN